MQCTLTQLSTLYVLKHIHVSFSITGALFLNHSRKHAAPTFITQTHYILLKTLLHNIHNLSHYVKVCNTDSTNKPSVVSNRTENIPQPHIGKGITHSVTGDPYIT